MAKKVLKKIVKILSTVNYALLCVYAALFCAYYAFDSFYYFALNTLLDDFIVGECVIFYYYISLPLGVIGCIILAESLAEKFYESMRYGAKIVLYAMNYVDTEAAVE